MESSTTFTLPSSPSPVRRYEPENAGQPELLPDADGDDQNKMESSAELTFKKKDVIKSRAQSFQSVLSTASLKSLKQLYAQSNPPTASRQNSTANLNQAHSKNFQSYIQAPVFSSISSYKPDEVEIGQQLPFHGDRPKLRDTKPEAPQQRTEDIQEDQDTVLQQHKLTLNALKKLSLSPMLVHAKESPAANVSFTETEQAPNTEPYQPAEVDLLSFASLTRQPKFPQKLSDPRNGTPPDPPAQPPKSSATLEESNPAKETPEPYTPSAPKMPTPRRPDVSNLSAINGRIPQGSAVSPGSLMKHRHPQPQESSKSPAHDAPGTKSLQQIKSLRSPMYIPAVLRLTHNDMDAARRGRSQDGLEHENQRRSILTSSQASVKLTESTALVDSGSLLTNTYWNIAHDRPFRDHGEYSHGKFNQDKYSHVFRLAPTRKHWVRDEAVLKCAIAHCPKTFNFFERRHHCRRCGGIFCKEHTMHYLYINHLAQFTTGGRGTLSRVCDNCIEEYNEFVKHEFGVDVHHLHHSQPATSSTSPVQTTPRAANQYRRGYEQTNEQIAGSVPANWSWSSF